MAYVTKIFQNNSKPFKTSTMCCEICHCQKKKTCHADATHGCHFKSSTVSFLRNEQVDDGPDSFELSATGPTFLNVAMKETILHEVLEWKPLSKQYEWKPDKCLRRHDVLDSEGGKQWITVPNYPNNFCMEPWFFKGVSQPLAEMPGPNSRNWNALVALWHLSASFAECTTSIAGALFDACGNSHLLWFHASWNRLEKAMKSYQTDPNSVKQNIFLHRVWIIVILYFLTWI